MLIELFAGFFVEPELVAAVKEIDEGQCALFIVGQSAIDGGFLLPYRATKVVYAVNKALDDDDDEDDEGELDEES